jgi:hypothetical protein
MTIKQKINLDDFTIFLRHVIYGSKDMKQLKLMSLPIMLIVFIVFTFYTYTNLFPRNSMAFFIPEIVVLGAFIYIYLSIGTSYIKKMRKSFVKGKFPDLVAEHTINFTGDDIEITTIIGNTKRTIASYARADIFKNYIFLFINKQAANIIKMHDLDKESKDSLIDLIKKNVTAHTVYDY